MNVLVNIITKGDVETKIYRCGNGCWDKKIKIVISANGYSGTAAEIYVDNCGEVVVDTSCSVSIKAVTAAIEEWHDWTLELAEKQKNKK